MESNTSGEAAEPKESTPESEVNPTNINSTLDEFAVMSLDIMTDIINKKNYLDEVIRDGALHLAKARYIGGNQSVSTTQLPGEDSEPFPALNSIKVDYHSEHGINVPTFALIRESVKAKGSDPLHWFGVLVPQNLRFAQTKFRSAIDIVVEIASLQARLAAICSEYPNLKKISKQEE